MELSRCESPNTASYFHVVKPLPNNGSPDLEEQITTNEEDDLVLIATKSLLARSEEEALLNMESAALEMKERNWQTQSHFEVSIFYKEIGKKIFYFNAVNKTFTEITSQYPQALLSYLSKHEVRAFTEKRIDENLYRRLSNDEFFNQIDSPATARQESTKKVQSLRERLVQSDSSSRTSQGPVQRAVLAPRRSQGSLTRLRNYLFVSGCFLSLWAISSSTQLD